MVANKIPTGIPGRGGRRDKMDVNVKALSHQAVCGKRQGHQYTMMPSVREAPFPPGFGIDTQASTLKEILIVVCSWITMRHVECGKMYMMIEI